MLGALKFEPSGVGAFSLSDAHGLITRLKRPSKDQFLNQLPLVQSWASRREERAAEIISQMVPQVPYWAPVLGLSMTRTPRTLEFLDAALRLGLHMCMRFKFALACPRPQEYSPNIQPMIPTPGYSAFPSGHATEAYLATHLLLTMFGQPTASPAGEQMYRLAERISTNRTIAGLHFPIDHAAGQALGSSLAQWLLAFVSDPLQNAVRQSRDFDSAKWKDDTDWTPLASPSAPPPDCADVKVPAGSRGATAIALLWARSQRELEGMGVASSAASAGSAAGA